MCALLIGVASLWTADRIENDLGRRATGALSTAGSDATVRFIGRDATLDGTVDSPREIDAALTIVGGLWGVRQVASGLRLQPAPSHADPVEAAPDPVLVWPQGSVGFGSGSVALTAGARAYLDTVVAYLRQEGRVKVTVRGYADSAGSASTNLALSRRRADVVAAYLVTRGVGAGRLQTQSFGAARPVTSNDTKVGRSVNRRVELIFEEVR